jgi:hypothetical protein
MTCKRCLCNEGVLYFSYEAGTREHIFKLGLLDLRGQVYSYEVQYYALLMSGARIKNATLVEVFHDDLSWAKIMYFLQKT